MVMALVLFAPSVAFNVFAQVRGGGLWGQGWGSMIFTLPMLAVSTLAYAALLGVALMVVPVLLALVANLVVAAARLLVGCLDLPMAALVWLEMPNAERFRPRFELWAEGSGAQRPRSCEADEH